MKSHADFYEQVWEVVRQIPEGRVTSYGAIARFLGAAGSSRLVGYAMNASHTATPAVPAHRVVNRNGLLTGRHHFGDPDFMQQRLEAEGVVVIDLQVRDFGEKFWSPEELLEAV